jgi:hypothetical protein
MLSRRQLFASMLLSFLGKREPEWKPRNGLTTISWETVRERLSYCEQFSYWHGRSPFVRMDLPDKWPWEIR